MPTIQTTIRLPDSTLNMINDYLIEFNKKNIGKELKLIDFLNISAQFYLKVKNNEIIHEYGDNIVFFKISDHRLEIIQEYFEEYGLNFKDALLFLSVILMSDEKSIMGDLITKAGLLSSRKALEKEKSTEY